MELTCKRKQPELESSSSKRRKLDEQFGNQGPSAAPATTAIYRVKHFDPLNLKMILTTTAICPSPVNVIPLPVNVLPLTDVPELHALDSNTKEEVAAIVDAATTSVRTRTTLYSGAKSTKVATSVPSLSVACLAVLLKNINGLQNLNGAPYNMLKPILDVATPKQLTNFEDNNPYLLEDTDPLWQKHCERIYRTKQITEFETWRDFFIRCTTEQEERLQILTEKRKMVQAAAVPQKMAKVIGAVPMLKPQRNMVKQIDNSKRILTNANVPIITNSANIAKRKDVMVTVLNGIGKCSTTTNLPSKKKKVAPLMAKTVRNINSHFRR